MTRRSGTRATEFDRAEAYKWASPKVAWLRSLSKRVPREGALYPAGPWTVLKLLAVQYTADFCLGIMAAPSKTTGRPRQGFGAVVYVDLNAGSGLVSIRDTRAVVAGTGLIGPGLSVREGRRPFDYHILVEPDQQRAEALERRVGTLLPADAFRIIRKGADEATSEVLAEIKARNANFVLVFDPYGFQEGSEESWARILRERSHGDLIATFQTKLAVRHTARSIAPVVGDAILEGTTDDHLTTEEALEAFRRSVARCRQVVQSARVRAGDTGYFYDVVYATRQSKSLTNDWAAAFKRVKNRLDALDGTAIKTMLTIRTLERGIEAWEPETDAKGDLGE